MLEQLNQNDGFPLMLFMEGNIFQLFVVLVLFVVKLS